MINNKFNEIWKIEKWKYTTVLIEPDFHRYLEDICMYVRRHVFTVFTYLLFLLHVGDTYRRYVEQTRVLLIRGDMNSPRDFRVALNNQRNETRVRARATETRRYITLLQTLSRCRVIVRGSLNQMRLSHEHPIGYSRPVALQWYYYKVTLSNTNNERPLRWNREVAPPPSSILQMVFSLL